MANITIDQCTTNRNRVTLQSDQALAGDVWSASSSSLPLHMSNTFCARDSNAALWATSLRRLLGAHFWVIAFMNSSKLARILRNVGTWRDVRIAS